MASKTLFDNLNALQNFIHDLFWPDEVFASHLEQRLKLTACDMIDACICHTLAAFQQWERKGSRWAGTEYIIPTEMCTMINVVLEAKNQSLRLCTFTGHDTVRTRVCPLPSPGTLTGLTPPTEPVPCSDRPFGGQHAQFDAELSPYKGITFHCLFDVCLSNPLHGAAYCHPGELYQQTFSIR